MSHRHVFQDADRELPMNPITVMRNGLGMDQGGSGKPIIRAEYVLWLRVVGHIACTAHCARYYNWKVHGKRRVLARPRCCPTTRSQESRDQFIRGRRRVLNLLQCDWHTTQPYNFVRTHHVSLLLRWY